VEIMLSQSLFHRPGRVARGAGGVSLVQVFPRFAVSSHTVWAQEAFGSNPGVAITFRVSGFHWCSIMPCCAPLESNLTRLPSRSRGFDQMKARVAPSRSDVRQPWAQAAGLAGTSRPTPIRGVPQVSHLPAKPRFRVRSTTFLHESAQTLYDLAAIKLVNDSGPTVAASRTKCRLLSATALGFLSA
jgi:hypothetical protein